MARYHDGRLPRFRRFFPFGDNIERARKSGVQYVAEPGGSIRDDNVIETCNKYGMTMASSVCVCSTADTF